MSEIPSTPADGNQKVVIVQAIADVNAVKLSELNATSTVDISCYLTSDGWSVKIDESVIKDNRLCSTQEFEKPGRIKYSAEAKYVDNTNSVDEQDSNAAKDTLVPGARLFAVVRRGVPYEAPFAAGQLVSTYPIQPGQYDELPGEENAPLKIGQKLFVVANSGVSKAITA